MEFSPKKMDDETKEMNGEEVGLGVWSVAIYSHLGVIWCGDCDDIAIDCVKSSGGGCYGGLWRYFGGFGGVWEGSRRVGGGKRDVS
jgi:hypothetical protein